MPFFGSDWGSYCENCYHLINTNKKQHTEYIKYKEFYKLVSNHKFYRNGKDLEQWLQEQIKLLEDEINEL